MTNQELHSILFRAIHNKDDRAKLYNYLKDLGIVPSEIGSLSTLVTTSKDNLVNAINEVVHESYTYKEIISQIPEDGLLANKFYIISGATGLIDVTLNYTGHKLNRYYEYMIRFTKTADITGISFPNTIKFNTTPTFVDGNTYDISIVDNYGVVAEFTA